MKCIHSCTSTLIALLVVHCIVPGKALDVHCQMSKSMKTYRVDKNGKGDFSTLQAAIDSIPENNNMWIHVRLSPGRYVEKVKISANRPCIFLEGASSKLTSIEWGDHIATSNSSTFSSEADFIIAKGITFKNTFNFKIVSQDQVLWKQAVAAEIRGDKCAFINCAFLGVQDTLADFHNRHYYKGCYIEGAVDFIFGQARSLYENCVVSVNIGKYAPGLSGFITAQKREDPKMQSGFVFKECVFKGTGKAYLGRAWGPYSTVVVYRSALSDVIDPRGWNAWDFVNQESKFTYVEVSNIGPGSDTSKRVPWVKKLKAAELQKYLDKKFINEDGWLQTLPITL